MDAGPKTRIDLATLNRRVGPWISLALGVATVLFLRRGPGYAPVAVGILLAGWWLASVVAREIAGEAEPEKTSGPARRRWLRVGMRILVAGLYQNVLFFLVPLWFASATWPSANIAFPLVLSLMALFTCFEELHARVVIRRPVVRTIWSAVILFATLVPVGPALTMAPMRVFVAASAALAALAAVLVVLPGRGRRPWRTGIRAGGSALVAAGLFALLAPLLPPVPVQCLGSAVGTGIQEREPTGVARAFGEGAPRVYAWFAVAAPERYRQSIRYEWYRDGQRIGRPFETQVVGGRRGGFRTWAYFPGPLPGDWRVDLCTASGQLVGRARFSVGNP